MVRADPMVNMTIGQIVESEGYSFQEHSLTTEDGYILTIHRVNSSDFAAKLFRPVVFFQHGLMSSSEAFVLNGLNA